MARSRASSGHHSWLRAFFRGLKAFFQSTRVAILAAALTFVAINHLGIINWAIDILGRSYIADANALYLHKAKLEMAEMILLLTGLDTGLEVLKSSTAGISFIAEVEVQVGNIVATVQQAAQKALTASLIAASGLITIELILKLADMLSVPLVTLSILVTGLHYVTRHHWRWMAKVSGQISEILLLFTLLVHFGLPLAMYGSSLASKTITAPVLTQAREHFEKTSEQFPRTTKKKLDAHVKSVISHYKKTSADAHNKGRLLNHAVVRQTTAIVFDTLLFPGFMLFLVIWVIRVMIRHALKVKELIEEDSPKSVTYKK